MNIIKLYSKYPAYGLLQVGGFISSLASWASFLAMLILLDDLTNTGIQLGFLWAISGTIPLIIGYFYGVWIDRLDTKKLMRNMELLCLLGNLLFVFIFFVNQYLGVILFLLARFIVLTAGNIYSTCLNTVIPEIINKEDLNIANGYSFTINNFIRLIGASIGGILIAFVDLYMIWIINVIVSFITYILIVKSEKYYVSVKINRSERSFRSEMNEGLNVAKNNTWVKNVILMSITTGIIIGTFNLMLQQFTVNVYKELDYILTLLYVFQGIASIVASYVILKKNILLDTRFKYSIIYILFGLSWVFFGLTTNYWYGIVLLVIFAILGAFNGPYERITMQNEVPFETRGRVYAMWGTTYSLSIQAGALITGLIIDSLGIIYVPMVTGSFAIIIGIYISYISLKNANRISYSTSKS